jgi:hypothetical protein
MCRERLPLEAQYPLVLMSGESLEVNDRGNTYGRVEKDVDVTSTVDNTTATLYPVCPFFRRCLRDHVM